jgi:RimJ/RimL family protein N-acetyltransferase
MTGAIAPRLRTDRLDLVPLTPGDAPEMASVLGDASLYRFIGGGPPTADELIERYRRWELGPGRPDETWRNWAIRRLADGRAIGHLQATILEHGRGADIAWIVGTPWQGRGYATEAATELVRWLLASGVTTITAHIHPEHVASGRVAASAGLAATAAFEDGERVWRLLATTPSGGEHPSGR